MLLPPAESAIHAAGPRMPHRECPLFTDLHSQAVSLLPARPRHLKVAPATPESRQRLVVKGVLLQLTEASPVLTNSDA